MFYLPGAYICLHHEYARTAEARSRAPGPPIGTRSVSDK